MGSILDAFSPDVFNVQSLTAAINKLPFKPTRLGSMGLFKEEGITTTTVVIEERHGKLVLVPRAARGGPGTPISDAARNARTFTTLHLPESAAVMADDVQNRRAFGSETQTETVAGLVNDKLAAARANLEYTLEFQRIGAIKGVLVDADGTTEIYDWYDEFGITQNTAQVDWADTNGIKATMQDVIRVIEDALGMTPYDHIHAFVGDTFFDAISVAPETKIAFDRWMEGKFLRDSQTRKVFEYAGVFFENYRGKIGATPFIDATKMHVFPVGAPDLFVTNYAPANYIETVNTKGLPFYAKMERMKMDKGMEIEAQSNPLVICTRPATLVEVDYTGTVPT